MLDPLLFKKRRTVPMAVILESVSKAADMPIEMFRVSSFITGARKREKVIARQVSMKLSKECTKKSLAEIGRFHGGYDHATVLHACKTINNLLDTHDPDVSILFSKTMYEINIWKRIYYGGASKMHIKAKTILVKTWIRNKVPLEIRQRKILAYGNECPTCGKNKIIEEKPI